MLANKMAGCLAHGGNVQLTVLGDVVCVLPVCCAESAQHQATMLTAHSWLPKVLMTVVLNAVQSVCFTLP